MSSNNRRLVYSSEGGRVQYCKKCDKNPCECHASGELSPDSGPIKIRLETKGRGGKAVTVLFQLNGSPASIKGWSKKLKSHCGTGGSVKDGNIEIQGDHRDRLKIFLEKNGFKVIFAGGKKR